MILIRNFNFLEKKDHIIRKMPNLTDEQKKELIDFFNKHPNYEGKIDWNKWQSLSYDDFREVLDIESKTAKKKKVKQSGIKGLKEGEDYLKVKGLPNYMQGYIPLNYEASKFIASSYVGDCEGKWCTAYQKDDSYWYDYTKNGDIVLIYFTIDTDDFIGKIALAYNFDRGNYEIFDNDDNPIYEGEFGELTGVNVEAIIDENLNLISKAYKLLQEQETPVEKLIKAIRNREKLNSENKELLGTILSHVFIIKVLEIKDNPLEVYIRIDNDFFKDEIDKRYVKNYILTEDMPFIELNFTGGVDNSFIFDEWFVEINSNIIKKLNEKIRKEYNIEDFDFDDYRSYRELEDEILFDNEDMNEYVNEILNNLRNALENAAENSFYDNLFEGFRDAIKDIGQLIEPIYEGKVLLNTSFVVNDLLENFKEEIEEEDLVHIDEIAELSLGINWDYIDPDIDHKLLSEIFEENLDMSNLI